MTYTCLYKGCGRTFPRPSGLSLHINRGHPKESFSTVLGKRKRQIEHEEERKQHSNLHLTVEAGGPSTFSVLLRFLQLVNTCLLTLDKVNPGHGEHEHGQPPGSEDPLPQKQVRRYPRHYKDFIPTSFMPLSHTPVYKTKRQRLAEQEHARDTTSATEPEQQLASTLTEPVVMEPDGYGMFRVYSVAPTRDLTVKLSRLIDHSAGFTTGSVPPESAVNGQLASGIPELSYGPFGNPTELDMMEWANSFPSELSQEKAQAMVDITRTEHFNLDDMKKIDINRLNKRLDAYSLEDHLACADWKNGSVKLRLPCKGVKCPESKAPEFEVKGILYRKLVDVIKGALQSEAASDFHYVPFSEHWKPDPDGPTVRVYGEAFSSDAMREAYEEIRRKNPTCDGPEIEVAIVSMSVYSDSTRLGSFGPASLWPMYIFFGNQSKYDRCRPSSFAAHHVAYFPSVCSVIISTGTRN